MNIEKRRLRVSFNSPAVLVFVLVCVCAQALDALTHGWANDALFSVYRSPLSDPLAYVRLVCHVFGHAGWQHLMGNMTLLLILGPMLEEKYGTSNIAFVMLATALSTGLVNILLFPRVALLGASGVVFAFVLLSSITSAEDGAIPLTFLLVAALYIGTEIYDGLFTRDNVSQLTHIVGGLVGTLLGFIMNKYHMRRVQR